MKYCYIRVSTDKQDYQRQTNTLENAGYIEGNDCRYILETGTGKDKKRPELRAMIENLNKGDEVIACELSRISRSVKDFNELLEEIMEEKKANVTILKENFHLLANGQMDAMTKLILNITSSFAEFERDMISDRTKEALAAVKKNGSKSGNPIGRQTWKGTFEGFKDALLYLIQNDVGQAKACYRNSYPNQAFFEYCKAIKEKYDVKEYQDIYNIAITLSEEEGKKLRKEMLDKKI